MFTFLHLLMTKGGRWLTGRGLMEICGGELTGRWSMELCGDELTGRGSMHDGDVDSPKIHDRLMSSVI